ncbi:hypothetical protein IMG5_153240 [Ichthyophthirius multifiliis]|uniref:Dpy-30 motif protein n=1 Tax=Ichthyophthirius multifiliis TaxID=5932 RepID=G0QYY2_ICHMU|nr:hypothetical protein IMG5_153240 [Ichthyophthirius multifiliis]EGR29553.1 hypothetical protein IMG5_153240 [Ichthyophthirius multifiliis]|eukprot:XP_004030789.1 hypothetical protein IMG5_153240 [Ichthyophthirius multifiliis]
MTKPKLMRKKMLEECDVYIYDLNFSEIDDVLFGANILHKANLEEQKTFILISDVMVWNETPKKIKEKTSVVQEDVENPDGQAENEQQEQNLDKSNQEDQENYENYENQENQNEVNKNENQIDEEVEEPIEYTFFKESDYKLRQCSEKYIKMKRMEDLILSLKKENLKIIVICSGILYGLGELAFKNHFKASWLQNPEYLPYLGDGQNLIPTIHINDLAKFVIKVAENPPENNYLFAIDKTQDKRQQNIIQNISNGVGSKKITSVEKSDLIDENMVDIFNLNVDMSPSPLLVGDEENPSDFQWTCQKGLDDPVNVQKVLKEFCAFHKLRPIKIIANTPSNERIDKNSKFDWAIKEVSEHYRIPIIKVHDIINELEQKTEIDDTLYSDIKEEAQNIRDYLNNPKEQKLNETLKVLYRAVKWRLNQNDCLNRGYILDNYPIFGEECNYIFYPQKKQLDRIRPKPKKQKKKKQQDENENEEKPEDANENSPNHENKDEYNEEQSNEQQAQEQPPEEQEEEEEPPAEEEQPPEEEEEDPDNPKPKIEPYYPESVIFIKKIFTEDKNKNENPNCQLVEYFSNKKLETYIFDTREKENFEIFECLRIFIERERRPYNYLIEEEELKHRHNQFYKIKNENIEKSKHDKQEQLEKNLSNLKDQKNNLAKEQLEYVSKNEGELDIIKNIPFRNYLMDYIVPELNEGLLEVSKMLPDDPVEFLAEYLYKQSYE